MWAFGFVEPTAGRPTAFVLSNKTKRMMRRGCFWNCPPRFAIRWRPGGIPAAHPEHKAPFFLQALYPKLLLGLLPVAKEILGAAGKLTDAPIFTTRVCLVLF